MERSLQVMERLCAGSNKKGVLCDNFQALKAAFERTEVGPGSNLVNEKGESRSAINNGTNQILVDTEKWQIRKALLPQEVQEKVLLVFHEYASVSGLESNDRYPVSTAVVDSLRSMFIDFNALLGTQSPPKTSRLNLLVNGGTFCPQSDSGIPFYSNVSNAMRRRIACQHLEVDPANRRIILTNLYSSWGMSYEGTTLIAVCESEDAIECPITEGYFSYTHTEQYVTHPDAEEWIFQISTKRDQNNNLGYIQILPDGNYIAKMLWNVNYKNYGVSASTWETSKFSLEVPKPDPKPKPKPSWWKQIFE